MYDCTLDFLIISTNSLNATGESRCNAENQPGLMHVEETQSCGRIFRGRESKANTECKVRLGKQGFTSYDEFTGLHKDVKT